MSDPRNVWKEQFRVRAYECDATGHASFLSMCNYFQAAAGNHALSYGISVDELLQRNMTWVLARLHVQIDDYPHWNDEVWVETWPSGLQGLYAVREFLFHHGDQVIGRGTSAWLVLDLERKRPTRVEQTLSHVTPPERPRALDDRFGRLPPPTEVAHERSFHVRYSDLDVNQHVNNVRYAEWAMESVPEEILHDFALRGLELQYRAEANFGDLIHVQAQPEAEAEATAFAHRLVRDGDDRVLAVARTRWAPLDGQR